MILVTGGTGLVGSHLLLELVKAGETVRAIYRNEKSLEAVKRVFSYRNSEKESMRLFDTIQWVVADINEIPTLSKAFKDVDYVYHCAAYISFDPSEDLKLRKVNIEGTANVVNLCISNKVKKLCHISSIATFNKKPGQSEITENSHWNKEKNNSMYAITKFGAEMEVWRGSQEGVPVVIVNPGVIIGPGFWNTGSGLIFKKVNKGMSYHFPKVTGFIGVQDVVRTMHQLICSSIEGEQFILVAENMSFRSVFEKVAKSIGKPPPSKHLKPWMVTAGWLLEVSLGRLSGKKRHLTRHSVNSLFEKTNYSSEKIKNCLPKIKFEDISKVIDNTGSYYKRDLTE